MHGKKLLFQELKAQLTLTPGDHKQFELCASEETVSNQDDI